MNGLKKLECLSLKVLFTLQPRLMFADTTRGLPQKFNYPTWVGSGQTHEHYTRLERTARDRQSSLLVTFVSYENISSVNTAPGLQLEDIPCQLAKHLKLPWLTNTLAYYAQAEMISNQSTRNHPCIYIQMITVFRFDQYWCQNLLRDNKRNKTHF